MQDRLRQVKEAAVAGLVPVRRSDRVPARREEAWPRPRRDPFTDPFGDFDEMWNRMVSRFFAPWGVSGEIRERERAGVLRHRGRRTGAFSYRTTLPAGVDADRVKARFDGGVLTVQVPRPEGSKPYRVNID
jgi:hypothetical protein